MKIICFGDSNTWGFDPRGPFGGRYDSPWPELLAEKLNCTVINQGENGREIPGKPAFFPSDTDLLIVMLGTNDLLQLHSPETVCRKMERFLSELELPKSRILLVAPPPMKLGEWVQDQKLIDDSIALAKHYRLLADRLGIRFADGVEWEVGLAFDGVHFTQTGIHSFANGLSKKIFAFSANATVG